MTEVYTEQNKKKHDKSRKLYDCLRSIVRDERLAWYKSGEYLFRLKKDGSYRYVYGADVTWKEFLAEIGINHDLAQSKIRCYEYYVLECGYTPEALAEHLPPTNAKTILSRCRNYPEERDELLDMAKINSTSDMINIIRERSGRAPMLPKQTTGEGTCILCHRPAEPHHYPRTRRVGGEFTIPLCREHHTEAHTMGVWTWSEKNVILLEKHLRTLKEKP